jgi:Ser/Thr protein kinase RdoA (MazF antagonist)
VLVFENLRDCGLTMAILGMEPVIEQIRAQYDLADAVLKDLGTAANDTIEVVTPSGHFALKLYNPDSKNAAEVQWEIDLTLHLLQRGCPVARPVKGNDGEYVQVFVIEDRARATVLFEWAPGRKPEKNRATCAVLGGAAAQIHEAANSFSSGLPREQYTTATLLDEQLERMQEPLVTSGQWQPVFDLTERLRHIITRPTLDYGVCHMDLTHDNVHLHHGRPTVFDFDSAGLCWRAYEPCRVLAFSHDSFYAWLAAYRSVRTFSEDNAKAVAAFYLVSEIRGAVWQLGFARSSRGEPSLLAKDLPGVVANWLEWERRMLPA